MTADNADTRLRNGLNGIKKSKTIKTIKMVADNADTRPRNGPNGLNGLKIRNWAGQDILGVFPIQPND